MIVMRFICMQVLEVFKVAWALHIGTKHSAISFYERMSWSLIQGEWLVHRTSSHNIISSMSSSPS